MSRIYTFTISFFYGMIGLFIVVTCEHSGIGEGGFINVTCNNTIYCQSQSNRTICFEKKCVCRTQYVEKLGNCALHKSLGEECETDYDCSDKNSACQKIDGKSVCACDNDYYSAYGKCLDYEGFQDRKSLDAVIYFCILIGILILIGISLVIYKRVKKLKKEHTAIELQENNNSSEAGQETTSESNMVQQASCEWKSIDLNSQSTEGSIAVISFSDTTNLVDEADSSMC